MKARVSAALLCVGPLLIASVAMRPLTAESAGPPNWLELQTPAARTQVAAGARFAEKHATDSFRQDRAGELNAALAIGGHFALSAGGGYGERRRTNEAPVRIRERWNVGALVAFPGGFEEGRPAFAIGLRLFDRAPKPVAEGVDPDLRLARLLFSGAIRLGSAFELLAEASFQTETNRAMREEEEQEFRRQYGAGIGVAFRLTSGVRLLLEARYIVPYNPAIDADSRSLRAYPGLIATLAPGWELYGSLMFAVRVETDLDRGFRLGLIRRL